LPHVHFIHNSLPITEKSVIEDPPGTNLLLEKENIFFVKTKNPSHRLTARSSASYTKVSLEANEDEDKKGINLGMIPNGTLVKVIEYNLGYQCLWDKIEIVDTNPTGDAINLKNNVQTKQPIYVYSEFLHQISTGMPIIPVVCGECTEIINEFERKTIFPDWKELDECHPFYDPDTCSYYFILESNFEFSSLEEFPKQREFAASEGLFLMLEFYDKIKDKGTIDRLISILGENEIVADWYMDERPSSTIKFLIRLPKKWFDAIQRDPEFFAGIPFPGGIK